MPSPILRKGGDGMSVYHNSFSYLEQSSKDFGWIITHFSDNADSGETDTFLSTSAVYSDSYDGTRQKFYGAKYDTVAEVQITVIKQDGTDFGIADTRNALRWLTGSRQATWMDFYIGEEVKYRLLGRVKNVSQYKLDARIVGLVISFESVSPYGYSSLQTNTYTLNGSQVTKTIQCDTDELHSYVYMNTTYKNTSGTTLTIENETTGDKIANGTATKVTGLSSNETITISDNMVITSDKSNKTFGNNFNFRFPRLQEGSNTLKITGHGTITFTYITPIKLGNIAVDINATTDPICDENGDIQIDTLDWSRISNHPTTLLGYGISDAYTKAYVDKKLGEVSASVSSITTKTNELTTKVNGYYTKTNIDTKFNNYYTKTDVDTKFKGYYNKSAIDSNFNIYDTRINELTTKVNDHYYKKDYIDTKFNDYYTKEIIDSKFNGYYTKSMIDSKLSTQNTKINELTTRVNDHFYTKSQIQDQYYNKTAIDNIVSQLTYDPETGAGPTVLWSQITDKPTNLSGYGIRTEVQNLIESNLDGVDDTINSIESSIDKIETSLDDVKSNINTSVANLKTEVSGMIDIAVQEVKIEIDEDDLSMILSEILI